MDLRLNAEQERFRDDVREFLRHSWRERFHPETDEGFEAEREFERNLARKGWFTLGWPREYGGQGADPITQVIFAEECCLAGAPIGGQAVRMVGPAIMSHGTPEQKTRFLPPISRAETYWCQGFSEPGVGSDLASVETRAIRDGDDYIINGTKIWTSRAEKAGWVHLLAKSADDAPKHHRLSYFLVDMHSLGISSHPIVQLTGRSSFSQVFLDNVRVPKENRLGPEHEGWRVATTTLEFERSGIHRVAAATRTVRWCADYMRAQSSMRVHLKRELAGLFTEVEVARWLAYRVAWLQQQGAPLRHEASMSKLFGSEVQQRAVGFAMRLAGLTGQRLDANNFLPADGSIAEAYMHGTSRTIIAGTSEIQRNILANRGLGLPRG